MNEKIKELMFEASEGWNDHLYQVPPELVEKFAELIVKECASICETASIPIKIDVWRVMTKKEISAYTALSLSIEIKERFGVE